MALNAETIIALALVLVPGYLAAIMFAGNTPAPPDRSQLHFLLRLLVWSSLSHAIAAAVTIPLVQVYRLDPTLTRLGTDFWTVAILWALIFLVASPIALGTVAGRMARTSRGQRLLGRIGLSLADQAPTAWDALFVPGRPGAWVRVSLRGYKQTIAGRLGRDSVIGLSPHEHDLYIEKVYTINERGWVEVPSSRGVWIAREQIDFIELFDDAPANTEREE